ncbi:MAG: alpha-2-macroglobulin family protein [Acidobacteriota bacterium]
MPPGRSRRLAFLAASAALILGGAFAAPGPPRARPGASADPAPARPVPGWEAIDRLVADQKVAEALVETTRRREAAQKRGDEEEWTRGLIREVQLRVGLHGYETAVRFFREQPWPKSLLRRAALELYGAELLRGYSRAYSWEIRQRERVESSGALDLKAWTAEQIRDEATRAYLRLWADREALGGMDVQALSEFVAPNDYPKGIRGTLRDALAYFFAAHLADTSDWTAAESNEVFRLDLPALLAAGPGSARLDDPSAHPLVKVTEVLADLEAWHSGRREREAALEARLERSRRLFAGFPEEADRGKIEADLAARLPTFRDVPWFAVGQADLAAFIERPAGEGDLVRARDAAETGRRVWPDSIGGRRCLAISARIAAPGYRLEAMAADGPGKRSIRVLHKNVARMHFRAWPLDLVQRLAAAHNENEILPDQNEMNRIMDAGRFAAEWSVDLPPTTDFRMHATFVVPALREKGLYLIAVSGGARFGALDQPVNATAFLVSDLALVTSSARGAVEARALSGETGAPLSGVEVTLWKSIWNAGKLEKTGSGSTNAGGLVRLTVPPEREWPSRFLFARRGADLAWQRLSVSVPPPEPSDVTSSLVFTDRSVYRPLQKILWKTIGYRGDRAAGRFAVLPGEPVTMTLFDPNGQKVESKTAATNEFGSAAGEFSIPAGRVLGSWRVESSLGPASASVRVEEYKRPTFEVTLQDPREPLRLNRPAALSGEARYYFGLPVARGSVRWSVTRTPEYPWWSTWRFQAAGAQTIAGGVSELEPDGTFPVVFTPAADERLAQGGRDVTYRYQVEADATDDGGETRSASRGFRLGFVSVEARVEAAPGFFVEKQPARLTVVRTDLDGVPRPGRSTWKLFRLRQPAAAVLPADEPPDPAGPVPRLQTPGDRLRARWETGADPESVLRRWPDDALVAEGSASHGERGEAVLRLGELAAGAYRLRYRTTDEHGAAFEMPVELVVAGTSGNLAVAALVLAEAPSVPVGGTARFLVASGLPGQTLFFEKLRGGERVEARELSADRSSSIVELPVEEKDRGGFSIRVTGVRDHQLLQESRSIDVPWDDRQLRVSFETFRDRLRPGARETWKVRVAGPAGAGARPAAAELLASMYDRSLDFFGPYSPPDPLSVYPRGAYEAPVETNLQAGNFFQVLRRFPPLPESPALRGDAVRLPAGYATGGPGRRTMFARAGGIAGGVAAEALMAKSDVPAASPPAEDRLATRNATVTAEATPPALRANFAETAFWQPQLRTDAAGTASIEFTVPDSVTAWNVWVHAITKDWKGGSIRRDARSVKDLMVRPAVPRFFREGDLAELEIQVDNATAHAMTGTVEIDVIDPETNASVREAFGVTAERSRLAFTAAPGGGTSVTVPLVAPRRPGLYAIRATAASGNVSDGELRPVPVLPARVSLSQSRFAALSGNDRREMAFPDLLRQDDPTRVDEQLVVTVDAQLFDSVLQALPYLVDYPYECTEQTLNRFVSTGVLSSLFRGNASLAKMAERLAARDTRLEAWDAADPNRKMALEETPWLATARGGADTGRDLLRVLDPTVARAQRDAAIEKLRQAQTPGGGFPWWPGGPPSSYMTVYILHGLANGLEFGVDVPKDVVSKAWGYARKDLWRELEDCMKQKSGFCPLATFVNYTLSSYPDATWYSQAFSEADRRRLLDDSFARWKLHPPYLKAQLALTLKRMGRAADARLVWASVMDSAKTDRDLGTYWAPEDRSWLWYNDTIETQAFALRTMMELTPADPRRHGLVQWLFLNKKLNQWKSTRATAEVLASLAHYLKQEGLLGIREEAVVTVGSRRTAFVFEPDRYTGAKNQVVIPGAKIDPARDAVVVVEKPTKGMAFASATWTFSTEKPPAEDRGDFFAVSRRYFRRDRTAAGAVLTPLEDGAPLAPGDEVEVQISLSAKHAAEYVHLRDPRPAGAEPVSRTSGHRWDLGVSRYEEIRDSGTNFFFERLPAGQYTLRYRLRISMAGTFRIGPATVQSMYAPEFQAYSAGASMTVKKPGK